MATKGIFRTLFNKERPRRVSDALKKVDIFRGLSEKHIKKLSKRCYIRHYKENEIIFHKNEPAYGLFIVLRGEVEIKSSKKRLASYRPFDSFGEFSLLRDAIRAADAIASQETTLCYFFKEDLNRIFFNNPRICIVIYQNLLSSAIETLKKSN